MYSDSAHQGKATVAYPVHYVCMACQLHCSVMNCYEHELMKFIDRIIPHYHTQTHTRTQTRTNTRTHVHCDTNTCKIISYTYYYIRRETMTKEVSSTVKKVSGYTCSQLDHTRLTLYMYYISQFINVSLRVRQLLYEVYWLQYKLYWCRYKVKSDGHQYSS